MENEKKNIALVLGANGGIGSESVDQLLKDNFRVYASYNSKKENLKKIKQSNPLSENLNIFKLDVTHEQEVKVRIQEVLEKEGSINTVILSVSSTYENSRIFNLTWKDFILHNDIQVKSIFNLYQALSEQIKNKIRIKFIFILSDVSYGTPPKGFAHYVTAKYAAKGLCKSLALELSQYGSTVNMISPGMVETDLLENMPAKLLEINAKQNPLNRNALPSDIAKLVSFLASEGSDYINGANLSVNGGSSLL
jgi:3-oxoacyl-[acyl-carrier protein] reductase